MKKLKLLCCLTVLFSIVFFNQNAKAQEETKKEVVIEKVITDEKGNTIKETIIKEGDKVISINVERDGDVKSNGNTFTVSGFNGDIEVDDLGDHVVIRKKKGDVVVEGHSFNLEELEMELDYIREGENSIYVVGTENIFGDNIACDRPFLGVMIEDHHKGLFVKDVFATTGADQAGLQLGDIITEVDGRKLENIPVLSKRLSELEAGNQVNLTVLRQGETISTTATLQDREANDKWVGKYKKYWIAIKDRVEESEIMEKAFMGVYLHDTEKTVVISSTSENGASRAAGLQGHDVLVSIGGNDVASSEDVSMALAKFEPGQTVNVSVLREGVVQQFPVTLGGREMNRIDWKGCDEEEEEIEDEGLEEEEVEQLYVFISKEVNDIPNPPTPPAPPAPPLPEAAPEAPPAPNGQKPEEEELAKAQVSEDFFMENFQLELEDVSVFPNPTSDFVNVSFRAKNEPIQITMSDATGRLIYDRSIDRFSGFFAEQIDLSSAAPGTVFMNVVQGEKKFSKQIIRTK